MIEKNEWKGEWTLPGKTESFKGVLTFDPLETPRLELFGVYESGLGRAPIDLIVGKTTKGWISLLDTRYDSGKYSNETTTGYAIYIPSVILAGYAFQKLEEILFTSVAFSVFNLPEWINIDGIKVEMLERQIIEYKKPTDILFSFPECQGKIEFGFSGDYLNYPYQIQIDQHCRVVFTYEKAKPFKEILPDISKFIGFVTLCTYEQSYPIKIEFYNENIINDFLLRTLKEKHLQPVICLYRNAFYNPAYKKRAIGHHLVGYKSVAETFSTVITAWFRISSELEQVIKLILRAFMNKYEFSAEKFMDAARALETFHRQNHNNQIISKVELLLIIKKIDTADLSAEHKALIKEKLNFAYEPTLKYRLQEMLGLYSFPYFNERVPDKDKFIKKVKDARNYYTHFDKKLESKTPKLKELFDLTENVNLILFSAVFRSIGIPIESFDQTVRRLVY